MIVLVMQYVEFLVLVIVPVRGIWGSAWAYIAFVSWLTVVEKDSLVTDAVDLVLCWKSWFSICYVKSSFFSFILYFFCVYTWPMYVYASAALWFHCRFFLLFYFYFFSVFLYMSTVLSTNKLYINFTETVNLVRSFLFIFRSPTSIPA